MLYFFQNLRKKIRKNKTCWRGAHAPVRNEQVSPMGASRAQQTHTRTGGRQMYHAGAHSAKQRNIYNAGSGKASVNKIKHQREGRGVNGKGSKVK